MTEATKKKLDNILIGNESLMDMIPDDEALSSADRAVAMIRQKGDAFMAGTIDQDAFLRTLKTQSSVIVKAYGDCKNTIIINTITLVIGNIAGMMAMLRKGDLE